MTTSDHHRRVLMTSDDGPHGLPIGRHPRPVYELQSYGAVVGFWAGIIFTFGANPTPTWLAGSTVHVM
jgi:hypothetical protein